MQTPPSRPAWPSAARLAAEVSRKGVRDEDQRHVPAAAAHERRRRAADRVARAHRAQPRERELLAREPRRCLDLLHAIAPRASVERQQRHRGEHRGEACRGGYELVRGPRRAEDAAYCGQQRGLKSPDRQRREAQLAANELPRSHAARSLRRRAYSVWQSVSVSFMRSASGSGASRALSPSFMSTVFMACSFHISFFIALSAARRRDCAVRSGRPCISAISRSVSSCA